MQLVGLTLLGVAFGAAGAEFLRTSKPELVKKVEDWVRRFMDGFFNSLGLKKQDNGQD